jgi:hypothetical protein
MTVADLRKALKGVRGKTPVYTRDHDHGEYETNGLARMAELKDQADIPKSERHYLNPIFHIEGKYFIVSV